MDDILRQLTDRTSHVSLTDDERSAMRARLSSYAAMRPVRVVTLNRQYRATRILSFFTRFATRPMPFIAALLALLITGGGVSYAAEASLPGDTLYPVKVHINEEIRSALTLSRESKAGWEAHRAERRVDEARLLVQSEKATPQLFEKLAERMEEHERRAEATVAKMEERRGSEHAARLQAQIEVSLAVHRDILERLAAGEDLDVHVVRAELLAAFRADDEAARERIAAAQSAVADAAVKSSDETVQPAASPKLTQENPEIKKDAPIDEHMRAARGEAEGKRKAAVLELAKLAEYIETAAKRGIDWPEGARVMGTARPLVSRGDGAFDAGNYAGAYDAYLRAWSSAHDVINAFNAMEAKRNSSTQTDPAKSTQEKPADTKVSDAKTPVPAKTRQDAENKRAGAVSELAYRRIVLTDKVAELGGNSTHDSVVRMRVRIERAEASLSAGDIDFAKGNYAAAFEGYFGVWRAFE